MDFFLIFFAIGFTLALIFMSKITQKKIDYTSLATEPCPPHLWGRDKDNRLQCSKCNNFAGTIKTNNGEY